MHRALTVAAFALLIGGCSTHTAVQTAHTVGKGNFQGAVEPGVAVLPGVSVNGTGTGSAVAPTLNGAFRYGVSEKFDFGVRLGTVSYELTGKYMFTEDTGTVISLAPSTTFWFLSVGGAGGGFFTFQTPLLIGIPVGESQFIVGPNLVFYSAFGGGDGVSAGGVSMGPGAHLAFSAKLGDNFRLHPELSLKMPGLIGFASAGGNSAAGTGSATPIVGFTIGLLFGGN